MILPFSTQLNGKPTYFVEKIHSGLLQNDLLQGFDLGHEHEFDLDKLCSCEPKLHTIREDKNNRWKSGNNIHFFINNRTKNAFQFAPVLPVVSVQKVEIEYLFKTDEEKEVCVCIDSVPRAVVRIYHGKVTSCSAGIVRKLAQNDGFDTIEDFLAYFNEDFTGKIIHWTDLRY